MYVKFTYTTYSQLNSIPVVNGQIIALQDRAGYYYDLNDQRYEVSTPQVVSKIPVGTLDRGSTSTQLVASVSGVDELSNGVVAYVSNILPLTSAAGCTLNVNGLGSKPIYNAYTGTRVTTEIVSDSSYLFIFNSSRISGGSWDMLSSAQTASTTNIAYGICTTSVDSSAKTVSISDFELSDDSIICVYFAYDVGSNSTLSINGSANYPIHVADEILSAGTINANNTAMFVYHHNIFFCLAVDGIISTVNELKPLIKVPSIYWCTYGVTSYSDISDALLAKSICAVTYNYKIYLLTDLSNRSVHTFISPGTALDQITCTIADLWNHQTVQLATQDQLESKYTKPVTGIPLTDCAFTVPVVDPTFSISADAADSRLTGARLAAIETAEITSLFTEIVGSVDITQDLGKLTIDPVTGFQDSSSDRAYAFRIPITQDIMFNYRGGDDYEWCAWVYSSHTLSNPTHAAMPSHVWVNAQVPLYAQCLAGDQYAYVCFRYIDPTQYLDGSGAAAFVADTSILGQPDPVSRTCITTERNNTLLASQFVDVVQTYYAHRNDVIPHSTTPTMEFTDESNPTILDTYTATNLIDSATLVGLTLRGISYEDTSYNSQSYVSPDSWVANAQYNWAIDPYYFSIKNNSYDLYPTHIRSAGQLAEWLVSRGRQVLIDPNLANIEPGDLVFFARKTASGDWCFPDRYLHISDVGVVTKSILSNSITGTYLQYVTTAIKADPCIAELEISTTGSSTDLNRSTLVAVCRPDLGRLQSPAAVERSFSGKPGTIQYDNDYLYICVADSVWKRVALSAI